MILWIRPAIARARVEREALGVRDRVVDGILSGDIDRDNPRAMDALMFSHVLEKHSRDLTLSAALATLFTVQQSGTDVRADTKARAASVAEQSRGKATDAGERRLQEAERDLDAILAHYYVRGSALWWLLAPLQRLSRFAHQHRKRMSAPADEHSHVLDQARPGDIATEVREASRGLHVPAPLWAANKQAPLWARLKVA
ncbi:minor tail protein [Mycobacterium phage PhancyPhin]|uniref:Minor tail protein n=1 Tax=Mycobacterium phage PhancyPhin TaxID=1897438 RepID=A0A1I9SC82_9CAUD|nr:minor tail protein [Mycobacterium phage PhancyPhin]